MYMSSDARDMYDHVYGVDFYVTKYHQESSSPRRDFGKEHLCAFSRNQTRCSLVFADINRVGEILSDAYGKLPCKVCKASFLKHE